MSVPGTVLGTLLVIVVNADPPYKAARIPVLLMEETEANRK